MGVDNIDRLGMVVDRVSHRVAITTHGLIIPTDTFDNIHARLRYKPLNVLTTNSGANLVYATFRNLGYRITTWYSSESDANCRHVTDQIVPATQLVHVPPHNTNRCYDFLKHKIIDVHIDTSPCQPWSRLPDNPRGFNDTRAQPFISAARIHTQLKMNNHHIKHIVENVIPHLEKQVGIPGRAKEIEQY